MQAMTTRKSYGQFCGLARALDHIGDRWTLLVVRELMLGPRTFRDLQDALDGASPNILVERLRLLVADGIAARNDAPPRSRSVTYSLTEAGTSLEPAVFELIRWGARWMTSGPGDDQVNPRWSVLALRALLEGTPAQGTRAGIAHLDIEGEPVTIQVAGGVRGVRFGLTGSPDASCSIAMPDLLGLAVGVLKFSDVSAEASGDRRFLIAALAPARRLGSSPARRTR